MQLFLTLGKTTLLKCMKEKKKEPEEDVRDKNKLEKLWGGLWLLLKE